MINYKKVSLRSVEELRYYWGVVIDDIVRFKSWTPQEAHDWVKSTWNIETTTTMNTQQYEDLLSWIREHCFRFWGLVIKLPNQYD